MCFQSTFLETLAVRYPNVILCEFCFLFFDNLKVLVLGLILMHFLTRLTHAVSEALLMAGGIFLQKFKFLTKISN